MKGFNNSLVFYGGKFVNKTVGIEDGKIVYIGDDESVITEVLDKNAQNAYLVPGFIDEHIHGAGNADAMDGTAAAFDAISKTLAKEGTTSFLYTTMTASLERTEEVISNCEEYIEKAEFLGARPIGLHLEGPFINPNKCGAQPKEYIFDSTAENAAKLVENHGAVKLITVAPEVSKDGFIEYLVSKGITVSAGHTDATYAEFVSAVNRGLSCSTHTYNAMRAFSHREIGATGGALMTGVYNELIADGIHVSFPAIQMLFALKSDKVVLITDAMRAKGMGDCESELGGQKVYVKGGEARLVDGTLAGSVLQMNVAVKNLVEKAGIPLETVIRCASENPAKNLGVFDKTGSIEVGKIADVTLLDKDFNVLLTVVGDKTVYEV